MPRGVPAAYYEAWLRQPDQLPLLQRLPELAGKRLGCSCGHDECHGNTLVRYAEAIAAGDWKPPSRAPQPHITLVNAWWFSVPYQFRPDTKGIDPSYSRYTRTAKRLHDAGYTADEIARFVREAYSGEFWPGKFMELEFVEKNIKAWKSGGNNRERSTRQSKKQWPPAKPRGRARTDAKRPSRPAKSIPAFDAQHERAQSGQINPEQLRRLRGG